MYSFTISNIFISIIIILTTTIIIIIIIIIIIVIIIITSANEVGRLYFHPRLFICLSVCLSGR